MQTAGCRRAATRPGIPPLADGEQQHGGRHAVRAGRCILLQRDRPLDGDQVGDDLDGLGVRVRPPRDLAQLVADAGDLPGESALDRRPPARSRSASAPWLAAAGRTATRRLLPPSPARRRAPKATRGRGQRRCGGQPSAHRREERGAERPGRNLRRSETRSVPAISCEPAGDARRKLIPTSPAGRARRYVTAEVDRCGPFWGGKLACGHNCPDRPGGRWVTWKAGTE